MGIGFSNLINLSVAVNARELECVEQIHAIKKTTKAALNAIAGKIEECEERLEQLPTILQGAAQTLNEVNASTPAGLQASSLVIATSAERAELEARILLLQKAEQNTVRIAEAKIDALRETQRNMQHNKTILSQKLTSISLKNL